MFQIHETEDILGIEKINLNIESSKHYIFHQQKSFSSQVNFSLDFNPNSETQYN